MVDNWHGLGNGSVCGTVSSGVSGIELNETVVMDGSGEVLLS